MQLSVLATDAMDALLGGSGQRMTVQMAQQMTYRAQSPRRVTEEKLYNDCCSKIAMSAQQGQTETVFQVPAYSLGLPLYSPKHMRDVLAYRLHREGWKVKVRDPDLLWVGWPLNDAKPPAKKKTGLSQTTRQAISRIKA